MLFNCLCVISWCFTTSKATSVGTCAREMNVWKRVVLLTSQKTLGHPSSFQKIKRRLGNGHPHAETTATKHRLLKALGLLQWITFIYFHYTIKQQETINFSHQTTSRTHKAKSSRPNWVHFNFSPIGANYAGDKSVGQASPPEEGLICS